MIDCGVESLLISITNLLRKIYRIDLMNELNIPVLGNIDDVPNFLLIVLDWLD